MPPSAIQALAIAVGVAAVTAGTLWTVLPDTQPAKVNGVAGSGFYAPALNAHFCFNARDSDSKTGNIWMYRYRKATK